MLKIAVDKPVDYVALLGLISITAGLPFSRFLISVGGFLLLIYLVLSKKLFKPKAFLKNTLVQGFLVLFIIHLIALLWTSDISYALKDLRIKLPLVLFPIAIYCIRDVAYNNRHIIAGAFCLSLLGCSAYIFIHKFGLGWNEIADFRSLSPKVSHIRLGSMYAIGLALCAEIYNYGMNSRTTVLKAVAIILFAVFAYCLNALQAATAIAAFAIAVFIILSISLYKKRNNLLLALLPALLFVFAIGGSITWHFAAKEKINKEALLSSRTALGNTYSFDFTQKTVENGHYIWQQVASDELEEAWLQRTGKTLSDTLENGAIFYGVVLRYMSSKNLSKDAAGLAELTDADIENILRGICNYKTPLRWGIVNRYHQLMREIDLYLSQSTASGNTMLQRLVYWRIGIYILKNNLLLGTGTGDIKQAFEDAYVALDIDLPMEYRFRAHNQYLSFFVAFGLLGGILALIALGIIVSYWLQTCKALVWRVTALCLVFISFLTEDTLETQVGVTLATFILCTALIVKPSQNNEPV